jgi:molecular chaperone GrpE
MSPAFQAVIDDFFNAIDKTTEQLSDSASAHKDDEMQALTQKLEDLTDSYKRTLAEMENVRKRAEKQQALTKDFAIQGFAKSLLDVADNLERAAEAVPENKLQEAAQDPEKLKALLQSLLQGVKMTQSTLNQALRMNGVEQYDPMGEPFNPELHNALFKVPDADKKPGHVAAVVKRGYKLKDRVLRAAEVGVTPVA